MSDLAKAHIVTFGTAGSATGSQPIFVNGIITAIVIEFAKDAASTTNVKVWDYDTRALLADVTLSALLGEYAVSLTVGEGIATHQVTNRNITAVVTGANPSTSLQPAVLVKVQAAD